MPHYSQIANVCASPLNRNRWDASLFAMSHTANMDDDNDKNGGVNHLKAWMKFRKIKGAALAAELGITPGMVSDLANSNRALTAKWLRRIAPALKTTPGLLLDHDPNELDNDIIEIWVNATSDERRQLKDVAQALVRHDVPRNGTNG
jgi:transcriptional regulator with XRE-family HTH domain